MNKSYQSGEAWLSPPLLLSHMHRREFLDPKRLAQTAGHVLGAAHELTTRPAPPVTEEAITLVRYARPAMATVFEIVLPFGHAISSSVVYEALDLIDGLEDQLTVYRDHSEVSKLNRHAFSENIAVSDNLFQLLQLSQQLSVSTQGAFDVTAGALVKSWGFFRGPKRVPSGDELAEALAASGFRHLMLDFSSQSVRFGTAGLTINLGSIGKGYALDQAGQLLREHWHIRSGLLHGGKSSVLALGTPPGQSAWNVAVEHPWQAHRRLATLRLRDRALATSAATFKHLVHGGKKLSHILDPRTGWPASGVASATAVAPSAAMADALATAFFVLGLEATGEYCRQYPEVGALLLPEGSNRPVIFNLSANDCEIG